MRYLSTYEKFKQLSMFPDQEPDKSEEVARKFVQSYRAEKHDSENFTTADDVISKYDNDAYLFNQICDTVRSEELLDQYEIRLVANEYLQEQPKILLDFIRTEGYGDYFVEKFQQMEDYKSKDIYDFLEDIYDEYNKSDISIDKIYDDDLIDNEEDFIYYVSNNYDIDYINIIDQSYWNEIIDVLYDSENNMINVYREMTIPGSLEELEKRVQEYDGVGNCWSYDESAAEAHSGDWSDDYQRVLLIGKVNVSSVDWNTTFERSVYTLREEKEIYIDSDETVEIHSIKLYTKQEKLKEIQMKKIEYIAQTYGLDKWEMERKERGDLEEKSTLVFEEPIKVKA